MKIILIENSTKIYDGYSRNNAQLRGAELALINYSEELAKKKFNVILLNNCNQENVINGVKYININNLKNKLDCDIAIVNSDANYFKFVNSKKNFLLSHSIQNLEKFIRHKQLLAFLKHKPVVLCFSNYHFSNRSFFTSMFGKKIIIPSIDDDFFNFNLKTNINKDAIFYSRFDRNGQIVVDMWKRNYRKLYNNNKLFINSDLIDREQDLEKFNIYKKPYLEKNKLIEFLSNFRLLIVPGHKGEVFCNVAEEAKALCIPIVTMGIGALSERVRHNFNGFICKNIDDFENKIFDLMNNDELYLTLKNNLYKERGLNTWKNTVEKLTKLFN